MEVLLLGAILYSAAKVCNLNLNQKGFYGDEDMESLWLRETLCLFVDLMQTFCSDSQDSMLPQ